MHTAMQSELQEVIERGNAPTAIEKEQPSEDLVTEILGELHQYAGEVRRDGLHIPSVFLMGECGPLTFFEDRNLQARGPRDKRFGSRDMFQALSHARSVTIVLFYPNCRTRIGQAHVERKMRTLQARLSEGAAIVVTTTSDRLRHWLDLSRGACAKDAKIEVFERTGIVRFVEGGL